jgi:type IV secretion system protein TrbG
MILTGLMLAAAAPAIQPSNVTASTPQIAYSSIRAAAAAPPPPARVQAANRAALLEPQGDRFREAVQVFPWSEGGLYRLYTAPGQITDIALEPGEQLTAVAAGDTVRWILGDTTSGSGASRQVHILLKPSAPGLSTNLVITTDRRIYRLVAVSTARTAMAAVSWTYPAAALVALSGPEAENAAGDAGGAGAEAPFHFAYALKGDKPSWRPLRVFDDGRQVFIEFPAGFARDQAPPLFARGADGASELLNYRVRGRFYVVDRLFAQAELRLGARKQQVVRIERREEPAR